MYKRKKRPKGPKRTTQKLHAYKRIEQRFGITLSRAEYDRLVDDIRFGHTQGERETLRVSHHIVTVHGQEMSAVYDKKRMAIVTFIPCDWSRGRLDAAAARREESAKPPLS